MANLFALIWLLAIAGSNAVDYCGLCSDHTMCKFKGSGATCGGDSDSGVSKSEAQEIVNFHNFYRSKIANGEENRGSPGPQPPAANMNAFVWDEKLAEVAQKWADQCTFRHDNCRNDPRFKVGQNIYWSSGFPKVDWKRAVSAWYSEVIHFNSTTASSFQFNEKIGHYSQMIWANTRYIGCGRTTYGGAYKLEGHIPSEYILSVPTKESNSTGPKSSDSVKFKRQVNPFGLFYEDSRRRNLGFFGGANFDANGAQGSLGVSTSGSDRPKPQATRPQPVYKPFNGRPGNNHHQNGGTRPHYGFGNTGTFYGRPTFTWGFPNSQNQPFVTWLYPVRESTKQLDIGNKMNRTEPVQNPVEYQLPSYEDRLQTIATNPSDENEKLNENPQIISSHKWSPDEWIPVEYKFTGRDQILICNYGPAGNYMNRPVYIPGKTCSNCPRGSFCKNGLCA